MTTPDIFPSVGIPGILGECTWMLFPRTGNVGGQPVMGELNSFSN